MGLFDFLKKSSSKSVPPAAPAGDKRIASLAKAATDKRAQTYDRMEAIQALVAIGSAEAAAALIKRFSFSIDPSITDQEEKEICFQAIVAAGKDVVPAVREACEKAEALTWLIKVLRYLLADDAEYEDVMLDILARFDTEYVRNTDPKIQVLMALEGIVSDEVRESVEAYLEDVNETVRFHAVETVFAQNDERSVGGFAKLLEAEESVRVKNKVAEGLAQRAWVIPDNLRDTVKRGLLDSSGFGVGPDGRVTRGGR